MAMKATSKLLYTAGEEGIVYLWDVTQKVNFQLENFIYVKDLIKPISWIGVKSFAQPISSMAVCHNLIVVLQSHTIKTYHKAVRIFFKKYSNLVFVDSSISANN
jgi:hypothetical protein